MRFDGKKSTFRELTIFLVKILRLICVIIKTPSSVQNCHEVTLPIEIGTFWSRLRERKFKCPVPNVKTFQNQLPKQVATRRIATVQNVIKTVLAGKIQCRGCFSLYRGHFKQNTKPEIRLRKSNSTFGRPWRKKSNF